MSCVWPASQQAVLRGENVDVGHYIYTQIFQPNFFTPAMLIGTIDFYHFILLCRTLTLAGGQGRPSSLVSFSC